MIKEPKEETNLDSSSYEIIRNRLESSNEELKQKLLKLNEKRKKIFGALDFKLLDNQRVTTVNNCDPCDISNIGDNFIFGYNVHMGLKNQTNIEDVFSIYEIKDNSFVEKDVSYLKNATFEKEFHALYKYYKNTFFTRFMAIGPYLYMVFQVGKETKDVKAFKWLKKGNDLEYLDNRSEHECVPPPQHDFQWKRVSRDNFVSGLHPHVNIENRLFVEAVGGDLTIKIEDNTDSGEGIYSEPVEDPDQTLDDGEYLYSVFDSIILLKIKPYQEKEYRYYAFSDKTNRVEKIKKMGEACITLPDNQGIIFSNGFFLQNGTYKVFENELSGLTFEKKIIAPSGEDYLYVFLQRSTGDYVLISYNMINRDIETPIFCHGYTFFQDGKMIYFKGTGEFQKSHQIQIWQTPFTSQDYLLNVDQTDFLYKIGNRDLVSAMAECNEVIKLIENKLDYETIYIDIAKKIDEILKSYYWLNSEEAFNPKESLEKTMEASNSAIEEYEKVRGLKKIAEQVKSKLIKELEPLKKSVEYANHQIIQDYVDGLNSLRTLRGELISAKEVRYINIKEIENLEDGVSKLVQKLSNKTIAFLSDIKSLDPIKSRIEVINQEISTIKKTTVGKEKSEELEKIGIDLQMLIGVISNLKIEDPTKTTEIIDNISTIFATLNQVKFALKNKVKEIASLEGASEFNSQLKLLEQSVSNFLDMATTIAQCEESLTRVMVQLEELESKFSEFDDFLPKLAEKREDFLNAFETKKINLEEARNKKAGNLVKAAERILKGISNKAKTLKEIDELNGYFASDLMVDKLRDIIIQLHDQGETVKSEDLESKLKTEQENAIRALKDKKDLFVDGENIIKLGNHKFMVNQQELDLTIVPKDEEMFFHLKGSAFFEKITDPEFNQTKEVWKLEFPSENETIYRSEYLAWTFFNAHPNLDLNNENLNDATMLEKIQEFMATKYDEGYIKGVHGIDALKILKTIYNLDQSLGNLKYSLPSRALAILFFEFTSEKKTLEVVKTKLLNLGQIRNKIKISGNLKQYQNQLVNLINSFKVAEELEDIGDVSEAAEYLSFEIMTGNHFKFLHNTAQAYSHFTSLLKSKMVDDHLRNAISESDKLLTKYQLVQDWYFALSNESNDKLSAELAPFIITLYLTNKYDASKIVQATEKETIKELLGSHENIKNGVINFDFVDFRKKIISFESEIIPKFKKYREQKKILITQKKQELRLDELKPRVLSSFVRNQLLDKVYLPLIGANFAKQIGSAGDTKRTDRMGLLLLVSPPGYGKTTLMEYISQILGLTFVKINGPSIGHEVTSLDPSATTNAGAKTEIEKLNLALEMGDNIMIYLDDIQHTNPEFLQKFISLCDGQRKIEGVYKGKSRTYDLRGKKVAVVMAGNPYTESGEKFQIPDMLANRADTYNLGDIIGENDSYFKRSYIENSLTSNNILKTIAKFSSKDIHTLIDIAEKGENENLTLSANLSLEEKNEITKTIKKVLKVRDVILKVNLQYIASAAQQEEYRTEPPFKMQGSYRNMNKIVEKIMPVMNDAELDNLIEDHYKNESQTLTSGAESNLLKFHEMRNNMSPDEIKRWDAIKSTYQKKQSLMGLEENDPVTQVVLQLAGFNQSLQSIKNSIDSAQTEKNKTNDLAEFSNSLKESFSNIEAGIIKGLKEGLTSERKEIEVINKIPKFFVSLLQKQFSIMASWLQTIQTAEMENQQGLKQLTANIDLAMKNHKEILNYIKNNNDI